MGSGGPAGFTPQGSGGAGGGGNGENRNAPIVISTAGTANTGGGGGGANVGTGAAGGSGVVIIKEPAGTVLTNTSGVWDMNALYDNVKAGTWTT
jgi:hypothetical protein